MEVNERLREVREDYNMTQDKIAGILNIGQRTYCDYELGVTRIPVDRLKALAKYYNLCVDYLSGASDIKKEYPEQ